MIFGDADPEDGWDADDPPRLLLDNLRRRLVHILDRDISDSDYPGAERLRQRLEMIRDDLAHIRDKVGKS